MNEIRQKIIFIGGGNMAQAIISGLIRHNFKRQQLYVVEPNSATQQKLAEITVLPANILGAPNQTLKLDNSIIIWAVKPQNIAEVINNTITYLSNNALHLSIAAGVTTTTLLALVNNAAVIRIMPNTPALIGQGMTALYATEQVSAQQRRLATTIFNGCGQTMWLAKEDLLDVVTAVSGSGPAYVFYCLNAIVATAVELGLTAAQARTLACQTFTGAAALAQQQSALSLAQLQQNVTSKGGTTFAALKVMEEENMAAIWRRAVVACRQRAQELAAEQG